MGFVQAVQSGFKNYTNFSGRASRSEAAYWLLFSLLVGICTGIVDAAIGGNDFLESEPGALKPGALNTGSISSLILFLPGLTFSFRRLHDINKSGWNILWALTIVGIFFPLIYWTYFKPGDEGDNEYGSNPLSDQREGDGDLSQDNFVTDSDQQDAGSRAEHK